MTMPEPPPGLVWPASTRKQEIPATRGARQIIFAVMVLLLSVGCVPSIRSTVVDVRATIDQAAFDRAYKAITLVLIEKGFDIKMKDPDLRIITTEYQKFADLSGWPPFDFFLQVKAMVRDVPGGGGEIALWPKVKEQNRINQNAFTEHPFTVQAAENDGKNKTSRSEAMEKGQVLFQSLVQAIADALGPSAGPFKKTIQQVEMTGM